MFEILILALIVCSLLCMAFAAVVGISVAFIEYAGWVQSGHRNKKLLALHLLITLFVVLVAPIMVPCMWLAEILHRYMSNTTKPHPPEGV